MSRFQGDEVVDVLDLAPGELGADLGVSLAAGRRLAPGFRGQGVLVGRRAVPAAPLGHVADAGGDVCGQLEWRL